MCGICSPCGKCSPCKICNSKPFSECYTPFAIYYDYPSKRGINYDIFICSKCKVNCDICGKITDNRTTRCDSCTPKCSHDGCTRKRCTDHEMCATHAFEEHRKEYPRKYIGDPLNYA
jgi:hypothetical protein